MNGFAIEVEEIEQEKHQSIAVAAVRCILDQAERGGAIGTNAAQLAVEIGLPRRQRFDRGRDRRVFTRPVEAGAGQQPDRTAFEPRMHPVAVELEFVQPLGPVWRLIDEFGELRFDPGRAAPSHRRAVFAGDRVLSEGTIARFPEIRVRAGLPAHLPHDVCPPENGQAAPAIRAGDQSSPESNRYQDEGSGR